MTYDDYLQHWGILGMKWGQRNGPPYPLSSRQMNREERKLRKNASNMTSEELDAAIARTNKLRELNSANNEFEKTQMEAKLIKKTFKEKRLEKKVALAEKKKKLHQLDHDNTKKNQSLDDQIDELSKKKTLRELKASSVSNGRKFIGATLAKLGTIGISTLVEKLAKKWGEGTADKIYDEILTDNAAKRKAKEAKEAAEEKEKKAKEAAKEAEEKAQKDKVARTESRLSELNTLAYQAIKQDQKAGRIKQDIDVNDFINRQKALVSYWLISENLNNPYKKD